MKKSRLRFRVKTLFWVTTLAALGAYAWARFGPERDYSGDAVRQIERVRVVGNDVTKEDVIEIRRIVSESDDVIDKNLLEVNQTGRNTVETLTGKSNDSGGDILLMTRTFRSWQVKQDGVWACFTCSDP